jgi:hypothetical protein
MYKQWISREGICGNCNWRLFPGFLPSTAFPIIHIKCGAAYYNRDNTKVYMGKHGVYGGNIKIISIGELYSVCEGQITISQLSESVKL